MAARQSLVPRYTQVDEFGPDDDYESGEETSYVTMDLGGTEPTLVPNSSTYRLIGLDTPTPYLQLSGTILRGTHDNLLGTELLFTDSEGPSGRAVSHLASTSQRISFRAVQLHPKDTAPTPTKPKGKGRGESVIDLTDKHVVERMTGKLSKERRKRGPKGKKSGEAVEDDGVEDAGGSAMESSLAQTTRRAPSRRASTKGKGRGKGKGKAQADDSDEDDESDEWVGDD
ncbi:hypothetical protein HDZ31DRAFT_51065 [Schizophyllum fasciatum]